MGAVSSSSSVSLLEVANSFMRVCNISNSAVSGSGSFTVPSYARGAVITVTGAGGGANGVWGGGGGGTVYLHRLVQSGQTISYVIGAGGAKSATTGGASYGSPGGNSNVTINGVTYEAAGGLGGQAAAADGGLAEGDIWGGSALFDNYYGAYSYESNQGASGEVDGTGGNPGLFDTGLLNYGGTTVSGLYSGTGGTGAGAGRTDGRDGFICVKWLACPIQTNVYTGGASGSVTAPNDAEFAIIKAWGAGGGGRNNPGPAGGPGGGGGGGGFVIKRMPVTGGSTSFTYSVGVGGIFGTNSGNGGDSTITGGASLTAGGGGGGTLAAGGAAGTISGGDGDSEAGTAGNASGVPGFPGRWQEFNDRDWHFLQPALTYAGHSITSQDIVWDSVTMDGTPGQGGGGDFGGVGGAAETGANGEIRIEWFSSKASLSKFKANTRISTGFSGPYSNTVPYVTTPNNASGYSGMIAETGNIGLLSLRDATFPANQYTRYDSRALSIKYSSASATSRANLTIKTDGTLELSSVDDVDPYGSFSEPQRVAWLFRSASGINVNTADNYDVRVTKIGGYVSYDATLNGLANNTWYNVSADRYWYLEANAASPSSPAGGTQIQSCNVQVDIRRSDNSQIINSFEVDLMSQAISNAGAPP